MADVELPPLAGDLLEKPLQGPPPKQVEPEDEDSRIGTVSDFVTKASYAEAARMAEELLGDGVRDVRIIGPYLMGSFVELGLKAMPRIFRSVAVTLKESWGAFGPQEKKTLLANNGLRWLFKAISRHLLQHEKLKDEEWKSWRELPNRAPVEEAISLGPSVLAACAETLPEGDCDQAFRPVLAWLQEHLNALPVVAPAAAKQAPPASEEPESEEPPDKDSKEPEARSTPEPRSVASAPGQGLPISPAMELLLRKLQAFDVLVERKDFLKAGIIAADVLGVIERFDPRVYLPMLFTRFFSGLSSHAQTLEPMLHNTDSLAFRSLDQLYRVDLDSFLEQQSPEGE